MSAHRPIARRLMVQWREGQGKRGSGGVPEIMRALEFIAQPIADLEAQKKEPEFVVLTVKQLRLAQHRAISQRRRAKYGELPRTNEEWWEQISAIAAEWNVQTKLEDWQSEKAKSAHQRTGEAA